MGNLRSYLETLENFEQFQTVFLDVVRLYDAFVVLFLPLNG